MSATAPHGAMRGARAHARLIGALAVKGERDHAQEILTEARSKFAADPQALVVIDGAAGQAGLQ